MDLFALCSIDNYAALEPALTKATSSGLDVTKLLDPQGNTLMHMCVLRGSLQCIQVLGKHAHALVRQRNSVSNVEPLHLAIGTGNVNVVHGLLSCGADPNSLCPDTVVGQMSAICGAVSKRNLPMVSLLLKAGANVDTLALVTAVRNNLVGMVSILLDHCRATGQREIVNTTLTQEAAGSLQLPSGCTPLLAAVALSFHDMALLLVQNGSNIEIPDAKDRRPLHVAASRDDVQMIRLLLQRNVQVDATRKSDAWNALHFAAEANAFRATTFLLQLGFPVNASANNLATTLHIACWNKSSSVVQALIQAKAHLDQPMERGWTALAIAAKHGDQLTVSHLLKARASVGSPGSGIPAPLFHAITANNNNVVSQLLMCNADPNLPGHKDVAPLFLAASKGYSGIVQQLLSHRALPETCPGDTKVTPLMQAIAFKHPRCAELLLMAKADAAGVSKDGMTPLFLAIKNKNARGLSVLLSFKADPNSPLPRQDGGKGAGGVLTPLLACVGNDFAEGCTVLLHARANANHKQPESGWTPLHSAVSRGAHECCCALAASTNLEIKDSQGRSPADIAKANGNENIEAIVKTSQNAEAALSDHMSRLRLQNQPAVPAMPPPQPMHAGMVQQQGQHHLHPQQQPQQPQFAPQFVPQMMKAPHFTPMGPPRTHVAPPMGGFTIQTFGGGAPAPPNR